MQIALKISCFVMLTSLVACDRSSSSSGSTSTTTSTNVASSTAIALSASPPIPLAPLAAPVETVTLPDTFIADDGKTTLHVNWQMPQGTGINDEAPFRVRWTTSEGLSEVPPDEKSKGADVHTGFDVQVAPLKGEPAAHLAGMVEVVVCDVETHKVCVPVKRAIEVTFAVQKNGKHAVSAIVPLPAARPVAL